MKNGSNWKSVWANIFSITSFIIISYFWSRQFVFVALSYFLSPSIISRETTILHFQQKKTTESSILRGYYALILFTLSKTIHELRLLSFNKKLFPNTNTANVQIRLEWLMPSACLLWLAFHTWKNWSQKHAEQVICC